MDPRPRPLRSSGSSIPFGTLAATALLTAGLAPALAQETPADETPVATDAAPAEPAPAPLAIRAGRVIVRPGEELENAVVLVREGRIVAVGSDVQVPDDATVLEGAVVCAGFMDPWSVAGLDAGSVRSGDAEPAAQALDVVDPYGAAHVLEQLVSAGVVATRSQIAAEAEFSGIDVVLSTADAAPLLGDASFSAAVGVTRGGFGGQQFQGPVQFGGSNSIDPMDRIGQIDKLVNELQSGQKYGEDVLKYERELAAWEKAIAEKEKELEEDFKKAKKARDKKVEEAEEKGEAVDEKRYKEDKRPREPKFDAEKAVFARVVNGEIPLVVTAHRALEIRELLRLTEPFTRLRMVLAGGTSALLCADELAARGIPVIVAPSPADAGGPVDELDPGLALAAELHDAGIEVLIGSGASNPAASRDIALLAALAVGHGLDREAALHAITSGPARAFDVAGHIGSVARGKRAELVVLSGDPLASATRVLATVSGGGVAYRADQ